MIKKGEKYNRLTAIRFDYKDKYNHSFWLFKCDCGNKKIIQVSNVKYGTTESCGCLNRENIIQRNRKNKLHGMTRTREYITWQSMKKRCLSKNNLAYKDYGARGITICSRWMKFENFYQDMGKKPKGLTLDRIKNNKGYYKENCRWATRKQQSNNKRDNIFVSVNGIQIPFSELAEMFNIKSSILWQRIFIHNWSLEKALTKKA